MAPEESGRLTVEQVQTALQGFGVYDYVVLVFMLGLCALIGIYYALCGRSKKGNDEDEYLMGGRNMKTIPVAFSLIASYVSGISLLGIPTETYIYGIEYFYILIGVIIMTIAAATVFLPVFHDLHLSSTYEYLERRFNANVRLLGSVLFTLSLVGWLPIVIYVPALAFNQVTGISVHIITPCVSLVCIFYTCVGGLKAVVWTDVVQTWTMLGAMLVVLIKGTIDIGGLGVVLNRSWESDRITFTSLNPDPTLRYNLLTLSVGATFMWLQNSVLNQNMIQRYLALPTVGAVRRAVSIFAIGIVTTTFVCGYGGLLAYATFHDCDPLTTKLAKAKDQILPVLVMRVLGGIPGMPGLYVAGVLSAALSSLSTGLNSMSAVMLEDFCKPYIKHISRTRKMLIMKSVVVVFGALSVGLVFVVERLGTVLQLSASLKAITNGASLGLFICGILLPWVNSKGMLIGAVSGLLSTAVVVLGAQAALADGVLRYDMKATSVEGCDYIYNTTISANKTMQADSYVFPLFKLSYVWYTGFGTGVTVIVALLASACIGFNDIRNVDPSCISPVIRNRWYKTIHQKEVNT